MSVEKITKEMYQCKCEFVNQYGEPCGHKWEADTIKHRCPKCGSRRWNRDRKLKERILTLNGESHNITEWARKLGISRVNIYWRMKQGFPIEQVLSKDDWRKNLPVSEESID